MHEVLFPIELKSMDDDEGVDANIFSIEGNAAVFGNVDSFGDIIEKGAFANTLQGSFPPLLWQHNRDEPIGSTVALVETDHGLFFRAEMPRDDSLVNGRVMPQLRVGGVKSLSVGFTVVKSRRDGDSRVIEEIDLKEISIVTLPANDQALISSFKNAGKPVDETMGDSKELHEFDKIQTMTHTDLKNALMAGAPFSREAANFIASSAVSETKEQAEEKELIKALHSASSKIEETLTQTRN